MKKFLLVSALIAGITSSCLAQPSVEPDDKISVGLDVAALSGPVSSTYSLGVGGAFKYELPAADNTYMTFSVGYESLLIKSALKAKASRSTDNFVPLKLGGKYYFKGDDGAFAEGEIGAAVSTASKKEGGNTSFAYTPGVGYAFEGGFEAGMRYEAWSQHGTLGQLALRLAFKM